jgi:two-component system, OmpR family, phosphate regulon sensor histidine kinase PhoR
MRWLLSRLVITALLVFLGAQLGMLIGLQWGVPALGAALAAAASAATLVAIDAVRGRRLLRWLVGDREGPAPRDPGLWGELAYRVERGFRKLDLRAAVESSRLDQFLSAIEVSPNGVLVLGRGDVIEWCNSAAADHFGLDPRRDLKQRITNLVRAPAFVAHMQSDPTEAPVTFQDARMRCTLQVLVREFGDRMKLVLSQDVTERERNEAMRRDFVANVSHEIRTPLTVLAGFVETLGSLSLTDIERRRIVELMAQQTQRMQGLVSDLLTLAQIEGSPRPAPDRWISVQALIEQALVDAIALSVGQHRITSIPGEPAQVAGVQGELASAVSNLMTNAVRYTPAGGSIEICFALREGGGALIEVRDTGIGIAKEHLSRVTERFYRVDGSRSRETGGTGLGLSIVKHVIQRHGGQLEIISEPGRGSCFRLVLPPGRIRRDPAADAAQRAGTKPPAAAPIAGN